jgi:ankyrin repeat protein
MPEILLPYQVEPPEYVPGMTIAVAGLVGKHSFWMDDYEYFDQLGRDPLQMRRIWGISDPGLRAEAVKAVLKDYPKMMHRREMLFQATVRVDEAIVRALVEAGVRVHPDFEKAKADEGNGPGDDGDELPDKENAANVPLHVAAAHGHVGCLKIFIESGVDVDARDEIGRTPFTAAATENQVKAMEYLLKQGADPASRSDNTPFARKMRSTFAGSNALEMTANHANVEMLTKILNAPGVEVTPLAINSAAVGKYEGLKLLLERAGLYPFDDMTGKQMDSLPEKWKQAILDFTTLAFQRSDLPSITLLLSYQYPTNANSEVIFSPVPQDLHISITYGAYNAVQLDYPDKLEWLYNLGVKEHDSMSLDPVPEGQHLNIQHLLDDAAKNGSLKCAKLLIEKYDASPHKYRHPPCIYPLYMAACNDKTEMMRFLLEEHSVDIHAGNGRYAAGPTALWAAITHKSLEGIKLLLHHGGPVNTIDKELRTIFSPLNAILIAEPNGKVNFQTEANAKSYIETCKQDLAKPNSPYVRIKLTPEDKDWLEKLQIRKSDEELREHGEGARELNEVEKGEEPSDWKMKLAEWPITGRMDELDKCCEDVIPPFIPAFKH